MVYAQTVAFQPYVQARNYLNNNVAPQYVGLPPGLNDGIYIVDGSAQATLGGNIYYNKPTKLLSYGNGIERISISGVEYLRVSPTLITTATQTAINQVINDTNTALAATFSGNYGDLSGIPSTFTPNAHSHSISDVTGLSSALGSKLDSSSFSWGSLSGKPTTLSAFSNDVGFVDSSGLTSTLSSYVTASGLTSSLSGKFNIPIGSPSEYIRGDGSIVAFPTLFSGNYADLTNIPTNFTPSAHTHNISDVSGLSVILSDKVDKVIGKNLSSEDYTTTEKTKLSGISAGATVNSSDATLLNRANHTGTQPQSTIIGLNADLAAKEPAITAGLGTQYFAGDKTWKNFPTIPTNTNQLANGAGFITGISSSDIVSTLGYTPYNSSNPSSYINQAGARTAVSLTTTGSGAASYNNSTGVLNIPTPSVASVVTTSSNGLMLATDKVKLDGISEEQRTIATVGANGRVTWTYTNPYGSGVVPIIQAQAVKPTTATTVSYNTAIYGDPTNTSVTIEVTAINNNITGVLSLIGIGTAAPSGTKVHIVAKAP